MERISRFRILAVIDGYTRECLTLVADTSLSGQRVARELDVLIRLYGKPDLVVSDNGSKLTSRAMLEWQNESGVGWYYIAPGKGFSSCQKTARRASSSFFQKWFDRSSGDALP